MVGALFLSPPTLALCINFPNSYTNHLADKCRNGFSVRVYSTSKFGMMGNIELERPSMTNKVAIKALQNRGSGDEWDKIVRNQSLLDNSSELEDMYSIENVFMCSKRQLIAVSVVMLAPCLVRKPSIAVETVEQRDGDSSQGSGTSSTVNDSGRKSGEPKKSIFSGLLNTKSWYRFRGNGFSLRVPPDFDDIMEPEDYSAGASLYGERAKTKTFAARFASPDRSEVLSVVIKPSNELKLSFLE
ncbi:hypothetical protein KI387_027749, partial [Taxus chinensis]